MKRMLCLIVVISLAADVVAQTTAWLVEPQYDELSFFAPGMYKAAKDGKVGLLSVDGSVILPVGFDAISLFYEGMAVFVDRSDDGWRVRGAVAENGGVSYADGAYYLIPNYMFFSEGMLPVRDDRGRYGYLDEKCRPAFKFTHDVVRPFSEGFAAVGDGESFHWIDTQGETIVPWLSNGGTPYGGTNFYNGKAYLWDEDGVMFVLNEDGTTQKIPDRELYADYLYRVGTGKGDTVEYTQYHQELDDDWQPQEHNGLWSYVSRTGKLIAPYQYEEAGRFSDGSAVAKGNGMYGLLHVIADESTFFLSSGDTKKKYAPGRPVACGFNLSVPPKWRGQPLTVTVADDTGKAAMPLQRGKDGNYSFSYMPASSGQRTFTVKVASEGAALWEGEQAYSFKKIERKKTSARIRLMNRKANSQNLCVVSAAVTNPSSEPVSVRVTLNGGGSNAHFAKKTFTVTVPPNNGVKYVTSSFKVERYVYDGWAEIEVMPDRTMAKTTFDYLEPFLL